MKEIVYGIGGCDPTLPKENIVEEIDLPDEPRQLDKIGVLATLLAVTETVTVKDAANAVGLAPNDLIAEAQAWAVASNKC